MTDTASDCMCAERVILSSDVIKNKPTLHIQSTAAANPRAQGLSRLYEGLQQSQRHKLSHVIRCIYKCKQGFKRPVQVSLSVQGYSPPLTP